MAKSSKRRPAPEKPVKTRKCVFCAKKDQAIDYKDTALLRTYISERGKIRASGHGQLRAAPARHRARGEERPRGGAAALYVFGAVAPNVQRRVQNTMKLILTADVDHLGSIGDTVEVKDGYGRNFLLPRGLAIVASRGAQKQADEIRRARRAKSVRDLEHANEIKAAIEALGPIALPVKTSADSGKLFGSVTAADVVAAIKKAGGPNLDKRIVRLPKTHIKAVGTHFVSVHLHPEIDVEVSLDVVAQS